MKNKNIFKSLILAAMSISLFSASMLFSGSNETQEADATVHTANYDPYTYSGSYYNGITGTGDTLRSQLTKLIFPKDWYVYSGKGDDHLSTILQSADQDPTNSSNMVYFYTRDSKKKNAASDWNREHCWPQSLSNGNWGTGDGAGSDLLHIRPTYDSTNNDRGNDKYGNVSGQAMKTYEGMDYGYESGSTFQPLDSVKGDSARIIMYVWTAYCEYYSSLKDMNTILNTFTSLDVMMEWHIADKPDMLEGNRNNFSQNSIQKNRNPFVDHPEYAWKIFGSKCSASVLERAKAAYPDDGSQGQDIEVNYTVSFAANGGTGSMNSTTVKSGNVYTLPANGFTAPSGKEFKCWSINGTAYNPGAGVVIYADTTITAIWQTIGGETQPTNTITVAKGLEIVQALSGGEETSEEYSIKGFVVNDPTKSDRVNNTYRFNLGDTTIATDVLDVYWGSTDIAPKKGDEVICTGKLKHFVNTSGTSIYEINQPTVIFVSEIQPSDGEQGGGETPTPTPIPTDTITVADALTAAKALADGATSDDDYAVKGLIVSDVEASTRTQGTYRFNIADAEDDQETMQVYWGSCSTAPKKGDIVICVGKLQNFVNSSSEHIYELKEPSVSIYNGEDSGEGGEGGGDTPTPTPTTTYTVTFNSNGGSAVNAQTIESGAKATKPTDPTREGYTFGGWYTDEACTQAFNFDTAISANITLYAKWTAVQPQPSADATLESIEIEKLPNKTTYYLDEELDLTGIRVVAKYSDNTKQEIDVTDTSHVFITMDDVTTAGPYTVKISYVSDAGELKETTFTVTYVEGEKPEVNPEGALKSIAVTKLPTKVEYIVGEAFDPAGLVVTAIYENNGTKLLQADQYTIDPVDMKTAGTKAVIVKYSEGGVTRATSFDIKVNPKGSDSSTGGVGCGGSIVASSAIISLTSLLGAGLLLLKKKHK